MGYTITLPVGGLLGIAAANTTIITSDTTVPNDGQNQIYILGDPAGALPAGTADQDEILYTLTLPSGAMNTTEGQTLLVKAIGDALTTTKANGGRYVYRIDPGTTMVDGQSETIEITNNQSVRLIFVGGTIGWLIS